MFIVSILFRFFEKQVSWIFNFLRIARLKLLYSGLDIDFRSTVDRNCEIICIKGGSLSIKKSSIGAGTSIIVDQIGRIEISNTFIGTNCVIVAKNEIVIKAGCLIAEMVVIRDQDHLIDIMGEFGGRELFVSSPIYIDNNVWIASKATILKGVTIGKCSVIGASAVVVKDVPPMEVWGGVTAKFLRKIH